MISSTAITRSDEKKRSATIPTKNGDIIAAIPMLPYARPACPPLNLSVSMKYVPAVTYQAPYTKYSRNIITDSLARVAVINESDPQGDVGGVGISRSSRGINVRNYHRIRQSDALAERCSPVPASNERSNPPSHHVVHLMSAAT